jgi:hypothetical protein
VQRGVAAAEGDVPGGAGDGEAGPVGGRRDRTVESLREVRRVLRRVDETDANDVDRASRLAAHVRHRERVEYSTLKDGPTQVWL